MCYNENDDNNDTFVRWYLFDFFDTNCVECTVSTMYIWLSLNLKWEKKELSDHAFNNSYGKWRGDFRCYCHCVSSATCCPASDKRFFFDITPARSFVLSNSWPDNYRCLTRWYLARFQKESTVIDIFHCLPIVQFLFCLLLAELFILHLLMAVVDWKWN